METVFPRFYDLELLNNDEIGEFDSFISKLPSNTPTFSAFERTVIPNNGIKTPKNSSEALNLYLCLLKKKNKYS